MDRTALLERFAAGPRILDRCVLADYPAGLLDFRPELDDAWTIRAHLIHVVEADIHAFTRYRFAMAEPGTRISVWDENAWHDNLSYQTQNLTGSLQVLKILRSITVAHLGSIDDATWNAAWYEHPTGGRYGLEKWITGYADHLEWHDQHIQRNEKHWADYGSEKCKAGCR